MTELQKLRTYYELLPANVRARKTSQSLLRAIQIAEALASSALRHIFIRTWNRHAVLLARGTAVAEKKGMRDDTPPIKNQPAPDKDEPQLPASNWESYAVLEKMRWLDERDYLGRLAKEARLP